MEVLYEIISDEVWRPWDTFGDYFEYQPWFFSLLGSVMVGLSGVFPLLVIPIEDGVNLKNGAGAGTLRLLLSFAVGGLLGDVFLHLLPEAWGNESLNKKSAKGHPSTICGLWVLAGFLVFIIAEKMFPHGDDDEDDEDENSSEETTIDQQNKFQLNNNSALKSGNFPDNNNLITASKYHHMDVQLKNGISHKNSVFLQNGDLHQHNGVVKVTNNGVVTPQNGIKSLKNGVIPLDKELNGFVGYGFVSKSSAIIKNPQKLSKKKGKHISGYLNLMANCIDNFTHGLAVGGSFLVSFRLGALTTFAILIHEIPHEVGDFAILLKSGFNRWDAARAQLITSSGGIFGALIAVLFSGSGVESRTSWILPFTAGGFLHIGLVTVLPELLQEKNPRESFKQLGALFAGITIMAALTILCD
uniref:Paramyosin long form n=3 Tax=Braconinae TaxID=65225 RepID=A0A455LAR5_9HYME|nr:paramyosin long form [Habrobracon hebetor]